ncbi:MAG TPA: DUF2497 domain-containing protein [Caulobacteraceae bacterium]|jgi:hypothetical protein|nr:DUF2497 domain-containing protein [Caulobacteraceae bacterium]
MRAEPIEPNAEPSLDEILASIRRIISEDGPAAVAEASEDVLVLTRRAPPVEAEPQPVIEGDFSPAAAGEAPEVALGPAEPAQIDPPSQPSPAAFEAVAADPAQAPVLEEIASMPKTAEPSVSEDVREETAAEFDRLADVSRGNRAPANPLMMPEPGRTLEDVVRDLMRPLVKEWLDEHLPDLVRDRVDEEVERIARRRVR